MEDSNPKEQTEKAVKQNLLDTFILFFGRLWAFVNKVMNIRSDANIDGAITSIKKDIEFKGYNIWILICSVFIASIGLNVNSNPVIIGAMLISPLMGPILGIGLATGTNDWETLKKSFKNLAVAVLFSVLTSTIYFSIIPLGDVQSELISRTSPTLLDVLIAIFGGLAGIVASSRSEKTNVVPGVAIATALMPPLCTAGYGLATGNMAFFAGAFYLFFINSVFISLSTFIVVKYLQFPMARLLDRRKEKTVRFYIYLIIFITVIPSAFTFYNSITQSLFNNKARTFISQEFDFNNNEVIEQKFTYRRDSVSTIEVFMIGEVLSADNIEKLTDRMANYGLYKTNLIVHQSKDESDDISGKLSALEASYVRNAEQLHTKDERIQFLENQIKYYQKHHVDFGQLSQEVKSLFIDDLSELGYAEIIRTNFKEDSDTIPVVYVHWKNVSKSKRSEPEKRLKDWLVIKLGKKNLEITSLN